MRLIQAAEDPSSVRVGLVEGAAKKALATPQCGPAVGSRQGLRMSPRWTIGLA